MSFSESIVGKTPTFPFSFNGNAESRRINDLVWTFYFSFSLILITYQLLSSYCFFITTYIFTLSMIRSLNESKSPTFPNSNTSIPTLDVIQVLDLHFGPRPSFSFQNIKKSSKYNPAYDSILKSSIVTALTNNDKVNQVELD